MSSKCHQSPHTSVQNDYNLNLKKYLLGVILWLEFYLPLKKKKYLNLKKINTESAYSIPGILIKKPISFWKEVFGLGLRER